MTKELLFDYISSASGLFPVIAFLYNYRHLDKTFKIIAAFSSKLFVTTPVSRLTARVI